MTYDIQRCGTCGTLTYFADGKQIADCVGPTFAMNPRNFPWPYSRYGRLEWGHLIPEQAVQVEIENMNLPEDDDALDVRLVNRVRIWLAKRSLPRG